MILSVQEFKGRNLQVLFCYVPSQAGYFRHAFLICDELIEPLPLQWCESGEADISQLVPIRCLKRREYMGLVLCSRGDAGLRDVLLKQEVKAYKSSRIELNILEFSYLAQRFSGTPEECGRMLNRLAVNDKTVLDENYTAKLNCEIAAELLQMQGLTVDMAENGQLALEKFRESGYKEYDCILMDIQMPVMDGCQATKAIRSLSRNDAQDILILALTANAFSTDLGKVHNAGMNDHIAKTINVKRLMEVLREWIV